MTQLNGALPLVAALSALCGAMAATPTLAQNLAQNIAEPPEFEETAFEETGDDAPEEVVVQATRGIRRLKDQPVRVEVIDREEIEEKILMTP
ncbi:MAG: hypothetical protein ACK41P_06225, partial [Asticcacaulis sp.]